MESFRPPRCLEVNENIDSSWKKFVKSFDIYMTATEKIKKPADVQAAMLLNLLGEEALELFNTFGLDTTQQNDPKQIKLAFENYIKPRKNVIYERFIFYSRKQSDGESFDIFLTDLKKLVRNCEFENQADDMLRDRIVLGINSRELQEQLLKKPELNLITAINTCRASEISRSQVTNLHNEVSTDMIRAKFNKGKHSKSYSSLQNMNKSKSYVCGKCKMQHEYAKCPAYGKKCGKCGQLNHFSTGCTSKYNNYKKHVVQMVDEGDIVDELYCGQLSLAEDDKL